MNIRYAVLKIIIVVVLLLTSTPVTAQSECTPPKIDYLGIGAFDADAEGVETLYIKESTADGVEFRKASQSTAGDIVYGGEITNITGLVQGETMLSEEIYPAGSILCMTLLDQEYLDDDAKEIVQLESNAGVIGTDPADGRARSWTWKATNSSRYTIEVTGVGALNGDIGFTDVTVIYPNRVYLPMVIE